MKRFTFPLSRVMDWRRMQARAEELKLEQLYAEIRRIDARAAELDEERSGSERALIAAQESTGEEMAALGAFQRFTRAEQGRLEAKRVECGRKVAAQTLAVAARRRDARLIEKVRERRLAEWQRP
jgi:hypothetical protein